MEWISEGNVWGWKTYRIMKVRNDYHALEGGKLFDTFESLGAAQAAAEMKEVIADQMREVDDTRQRQKQYLLRMRNGGQCRSH